MSQLLFNQASVDATVNPLTRRLRAILLEQGVTEDELARRSDAYHLGTFAGLALLRNNLRKLLSQEDVTFRAFQHILQCVLGQEITNVHVETKPIAPVVSIKTRPPADTIHILRLAPAILDYFNTLSQNDIQTFDITYWSPINTQRQLYAQTDRVTVYDDYVIVATDNAQFYVYSNANTYTDGSHGVYTPTCDAAMQLAIHWSDTTDPTIIPLCTNPPVLVF